MKILIISSGRAGSSALSIGLSNSINLCNLFFEPFVPPNIDGRDRGLSQSDLSSPTNFLKHHYFLKNSNFSLVEKHIIWDPCIWDYISFSQIFYKVEYLHKIRQNMTIEACVNFYLEYSKLFDVVILLGRKNIDDLVNSWGQANSTGNFFLPYKNNLNLNIKPKKEMPNILLLEEMLNKLSNKLNLPITYYEDLFSGNKEFIKNFLKINNIPIDDFSLFCEYLDPKNRYKQI
tara:strand:- start:54 stop:749 length:696 start_codon:yes stop_codon:yes gene_type:complete